MNKIYPEVLENAINQNNYAISHVCSQSIKMSNTVTRTKYKNYKTHNNIITHFVIAEKILID